MCARVSIRIRCRVKGISQPLVMLVSQTSRRRCYSWVMRLCKHCSFDFAINWHKTPVAGCYINRCENLFLYTEVWSLVSSSQNLLRSGAILNDPV